MLITVVEVEARESDEVGVGASDKGESADNGEYTAVSTSTFTVSFPFLLAIAVSCNSFRSIVKQGNDKYGSKLRHLWEAKMGVIRWASLISDVCDVASFKLNQRVEDCCLR